jgi:hypothetical protein
VSKKNTRSLDVIAGEINRIDRDRIFNVGDLLLEARGACEHGKWGEWLIDEFGWFSPDTAERYMAVARLAAKFRNLRNLQLAKTTFYDLAERAKYPDAKADLPAIINELAKHATSKRLNMADAEYFIAVGIARRQHGDSYSDATLWALSEWGEPKFAEALKAKNPQTDDEAEAIVDAVRKLGDLDEPGVDEPNADEPGVDEPGADEPGADEPGVDEPGADEPGVDEPGADEAGADEAEVEVDEPDVDEPDVDEPDVNELGVDESEADESLCRALHVVLHHARRSPPITVSGINGAELIEIKDFVQQLHARMANGSRVKLVADRAEARARVGKG